MFTSFLQIYPVQFQYPSEFWMQYHLFKKNRCWQPIKLTRFLYSQRPAPRCDEALLLGSVAAYSLYDFPKGPGRQCSGMYSCL